MSDKSERDQFSRRIQKEVVAAMRTAGIPPELIYAYERTGFIIVEEAGYKKLSTKDRAEYDAAIDEYQSSNKSRK